MLPLDPDTLHDEIVQITEIINKVKAKIIAGIPGEDIQADDIEIHKFLLRMKRELTLAASRLLAVVDSMGDE